MRFSKCGSRLVTKSASVFLVICLFPADPKDSGSSHRWWFYPGDEPLGFRRIFRPERQKWNFQRLRSPDLMAFCVRSKPRSCNFAARSSWDRPRLFLIFRSLSPQMLCFSLILIFFKLLPSFFLQIFTFLFFCEISFSMLNITWLRAEIVPPGQDGVYLNRSGTEKNNLLFAVRILLLLMGGVRIELHFYTVMLLCTKTIPDEK